MRKWVCNVCGYIHEGDEPPAVCPICGVGPDEFSLLPEPAAPAAKATPAKRWKCDVCDYIHVGDEPPAECPVCGVGREHFVLLSDHAVELTPDAVRAADAGTLNAALDMVSYGLYIVSSKKDGKINGQTANTVFQLTSQPPQIGLCINKRNLTHEYINASGVAAISVLALDQCDLVKHFGYQSGRTVDKFATVDYVIGQTGCPIVKNCLGYLEVEIIPEKTVDVGSHTLFVAKVVAGRPVGSHSPLTYAFFRKVK
ncbi:MAG: flavin reductase [Negativicutes bacterium]|nr:flavin reductase [Negativicutes bacterium]